MSDDSIRFDDGAAYEAMMGRWSLLAGARFLDWLSPLPAAGRWLDVGCGNGAFTELIVQRCAPEQVLAFDPSPGQLAYARHRLPVGAPVVWQEGDAMRLPVADGSVDVAVMALVLFFVPDPAAGVAEMGRAVRAGGRVAAYHWDILGGGFPLADIHAEARGLGMVPRLPPSVEAAGLDASAALWRQAGLQQVQTCRIAVERRFESFDAYWDVAANSNTLRPVLGDLQAADPRERLKANVQRRWAAKDGCIPAVANAICGIKP